MSKPKSGAHVHKLIAKTAHEMAGALYEAHMQDNMIREAWKRMHPGASEKGLLRAYIIRYAPSCIEGARATLAHMLSRPDIDEVLKTEISEALILDAQLIKGRRENHQVIG